MMKRGLVLGKFMPLHLGHIGLINYAGSRCDNLIVLLCVSNKEAIPGNVREKWLLETFKGRKKIEIVVFEYDEEELPNTSVSSNKVSKIWANAILKTVGNIDIVFSSELYGEYLAGYLSCGFDFYDLNRSRNAISATAIRKSPFQNWHFISQAAKPYFVKKVCIVGTESSGKTILTERLATYYKTAFVEEMARKIIGETESCTESQLHQIAELHANTILGKLKEAHKILIVDTDLNITRSYSQFLFNKELIVPEWIELANQFDCYLYLENDAQFIQDGTRLDKLQRDLLNVSHKKEFAQRNIVYYNITGSWENRFRKSIEIIDQLLMQ